MIVSIEQHQGKLLISYVKKDGTIAFTQFIIPPSHQYIYTYALKGRGIPNLLSWDEKPVRKVPARFINKYRIQEFFIDAGDEMTKHLFEANTPNLSVIDIEVEVTEEGFADPEYANNKITSISYCRYPDIIVLGSKPLSGEDCNQIEQNINNHTKKFNRYYNFVYKYHANEADMIYDFLYNYVRKSPLITGWNIWTYDWRYILNRCNKLNMDINWLSPTGQWFQHKVKDRNKDVIIMIPFHKLIIDYMSIYQKWDRTVEVKENDTLDFVSEEALKIQKVKYSGTLQELYDKDYSQFVFYNAIDSILVELLDIKLKTMETFFGLSNITRVEAMNAFSPIAMLEATLVRYTYEKGRVFPKREEISERGEYEGAFVFEPIPNFYPWVASFDFASLYPSIMRQFKISIENFKFKDKSYKPNENEIKCSSGAVFDASYEPLLCEILTDYYNKRKESKKIYLNAEKEAAELKKILHQRTKNISSQMDI